MAIAELAREASAKPRFESEPILPFSTNQAAEMVRMYWSNRRFLGGPTPLKKDPGMARTAGVIAVQEMFLGMLGLERLTGKTRPQEFLIPIIKPVQKVSVENLIDAYFDNRQTFVHRGLDTGDWTKDQSDAKLFGRVTILSFLLEALGQRKVVIDINAWVEKNTQEVDWVANRSTGIGELQ